jgi:hypothetical protein
MNDITFLIGLLSYPGIIIFLLKNQSEENKRFSILTSDKSEIYVEYKNIIKKRLLIKSARILKFGLAVLISGFLFLVITNINYSINIDGLTDLPSNDNILKYEWFGYSYDYVSSIQISIYILMIGTASVIYYLIEQKRLLELKIKQNRAN